MAVARSCSRWARCVRPGRRSIRDLGNQGLFVSSPVENRPPLLSAEDAVSMGAGTPLVSTDPATCERGSAAGCSDE